MIRQSSFSDNAAEQNVEVNEKLPSLPAISSPVREEKSLMDLDDMLPHIGEFGPYHKMLLTSLAPSALCKQLPLRDTGEHRSLWI